MSLFSGPLTGRKVGAIFLGAFGTIIAANLVLVYFAVGTFPGIEVKNTYTDSMGFDKRRAAQVVLNWRTTMRYEDGLLRLSITDADGKPVYAPVLNVRVGLATKDSDDKIVEFKFTGRDYTAYAELPKGNWQARILANSADGTEFRRVMIIDMRGAK